MKCDFWRRSFNFFMQKDFVVFNSKLEDKNISQTAKFAFDELLLDDVAVSSFLLILAYGVKLEKNVSSFSNGKLSLDSREKNEIKKFEKTLAKLSNDYQKNKELPLSIVLAFNFEKDVFMNNFKKNISKTTRMDIDESPKLNVSPVEPKYSLSQMVLCDSVKEELLKVIVLIKNLDKIYNEWGFSNIDATPRCVVNFFGPPGTGKTMAAHAVASELGQKILPLNYSDIESKFWGDAPKNLASAFKIAESEKCVLFFDEADSFLGKRITNVSSSSDQAVNSLRSQMLILLENFTGTVIFATNLHKNYDKAFESRILKHIEFFLPDEKLRAQIILKMIPDNAPISNDVKNPAFIEKLAEIIEGFSPREIKNTILDVLTTSLYSKRNLDVSLFEEVFSKAKENFDSLQNEGDENQKNRVQEKIKNHFANNNEKTEINSDISESK